MNYVVKLIRYTSLGLFVYAITSGKMSLWLGIFAISLMAGLFGGRLYCGYVCPMNTLMIPTQWLSQKLRLQSSKVPKWLESEKTAWILMILSVGTMIVSKKIMSIDLPMLAVFLFLSVIVTLRYEAYVFHNKICPFGVLQGLAGRYARFSKKVNPVKCIGCKKCETVCPSKAIVVSKADKIASIDKRTCHQCLNCQLVCPTNAIQYGKI